MKELVVVAAHGPDFVAQCVDSIAGVEHIVVDTGPEGPRPGGHPTGAYRWVYENVHADRYLFVQDCMTALVPDPCSWFRDQLPAEGGAVAWGRFGMAFDTPSQQHWVLDQYPGQVCEFGIMGPIFYTPRSSLDILAEKNLLPAVPSNRIQAQGTERAWAYAYVAAGLPVVGPMWSQPAMQSGFNGWRKIWAARP